MMRSKFKLLDFELPLKSKNKQKSVRAGPNYKKTQKNKKTKLKDEDEAK